MPTPDLFLLMFITVGVIARANVVAVAASCLLALRLLKLDRWVGLFERRSLEIGLLFLMIAVLTPLASGDLSAREMGRTVFSIPGALTIAGGIAATVMNKKGLALMQHEPALLLCVVMGSVIGVVVFRGMPVGPLMAAALAALGLSLWQWIR